MDFDGFFQSVITGERSANSSTFWKQQLAPFEALRSQKQAGTALEAALEALQYGFPQLPAGGNAKLANHLLHEGNKIARLVGKERKRVNDKDTWEHLSALQVLNRRGLFDRYIAFIDGLGVGSSMSTARHFYYANLLADILSQAGLGGKRDILEIGAGAGNLAAILSTMGQVARYSIVDLPEMLINSGYWLSKRFGCRASFTEYCPDHGTFNFLEPGDISKIPDNSQDVILNFNSFMEMTLPQVNEYFDHVYRVARDGALFLNVNRRQPALPLADGGTYDNNPLLYPYRPSDRILRWEPEELQQATRSAFCATPISFAILRASVIVK